MAKNRESNFLCRSFSCAFAFNNRNIIGIISKYTFLFPLTEHFCLSKAKVFHLQRCARLFITNHRTVLNSADVLEERCVIRSDNWNVCSAKFHRWATYNQLFGLNARGCNGALTDRCIEI